MRHAVFILFCLFSLHGYSQGFKVRHYLPNALNNKARAIFETSPGAYITGGFVTDTVNGVSLQRICLMGLDAQGQITWVKKYGNKKLQYLNNTFISRSYYRQGNHLYYAGCVRDSTNAQIGVLIKFGLNGDTLWQRIYRDTSQDVIPQMVTGSVDGGFLITGFFQNWNNNTRPCLLIKTDAVGNELWRKELNKVFPNTSDGKAIIQDSASGKIVIGGYQYIGNSSSWNNYDNILILDSLGTLLSRHNYAGATSILRDLIQTSDKKIVAVGATYQTVMGTDYSRSYIVKFDLNNPGGPIWFNPAFDRLNSRNIFSCIHELSNGDLLIGGSYDTLLALNILPNWLTRLVRINKNGNLVWKKYYSYWHTPGAANYLDLVSLNLTSDNGWVAALYSYNNPLPAPAIFIKWDSTGCDTNQAWCQMVAAGISRHYLQEQGIRVYPNPGSEKMQVSCPGGATGLVLYDPAGRELRQEELDPGMRVYALDLNDLAGGIYLLNLYRDKTLIYSGKVVKQE